MTSLANFATPSYRRQRAGGGRAVARLTFSGAGGRRRQPITNESMARFGRKERGAHPRAELTLARPRPGQGTKNNAFGVIVIPPTGSFVMAPVDMST
jgi:hypothetical protein